MMNDEHIESLFPFYALGTLTEAEQAQVERYIETRPSAKAELEAMIAATAELAFLAEPEPGTTAEKATLMARIRKDKTAREPEPTLIHDERLDRVIREPLLERLRRLLAPLRAPAFAALALLLVALTFWSLNLRGQVGALNDRIAALEGDVDMLEEERQALQTAADDLAAQNAVLNQQIQGQQQVLVALGRSESVTVLISGTEAEPGSSGYLVFDGVEQVAYLSVSDLPELTVEQDYQLWLIDGETPFSAGVFTIGQPGQEIYTFPVGAEAVNFNAVGVSVEPAGGSSQPTGDIVLLGSRSS